MTELTGVSGRTALVVGGGENLGEAIVRAFADAGANVAVNVRSNSERAEKVAADARERGVTAISVVGDVSDPKAVESVLEQVDQQLGPVDILVHCVAVRPWVLVTDTTIEQWHQVMNTNCSSYFYLTRLLLPSMAERGFGRIIAIGGPAATVPYALNGAVAASKAGLAALTRTIAFENGAHGITANIVNPTITETTAAKSRTPERLATLPIPRAGKLDEIAFACLYLASEEASYMTGQTLRVDGGFEM